MKPKICIKTPTLMQMETTDCGAVALGIVLAFYGCHVPASELRKQCKVSRDGVSVANLIASAKFYHLNATVQKDCPSPENFNEPMIIFCNLKHFIVLEGFKGKKVYVNDPGTGRRTMDMTTLKKEFSGLAIQLTPSLQFQGRAEEKKWLNNAVCWMKKERKSLSTLFASTVGLTLLNLATPVFSKYFVDHYSTQNSFKAHPQFFAIILFTLVMQIAMVYIQRKIIRSLEKESSKKMGSVLINKLFHLPPIFFAQRRTADLAQRLQSVERLAEILNGSLSVTVVCVLQLITSLMLMFYYNATLTLLACLIFFINFSFVYFSKNYRYQLATALKKEFANLNMSTMSIFSMILQIKMKGQDQFLTQWEQQLARYLNAQKQLSLTNIIIQTGTYLFVGIIQVLILGLGSWLVINNALSVGALMAFNALFLSLNALIFQMASLANLSHQAKLDAEKILDVTEYPQLSSKSNQLNTPFPIENNLSSSPRGKIEIINLTFGYNQAGKPLFDKINLTIDPHSKVAITGPSGSGKSTLANLIAGLYVPWSGLILIDGIPVSELSKEKQVSSLTLMGQEQFFMKGTIKDNLCLWDKNYSEAELLRAMQIARIDDLVLNSNDGFNFQLSEGATNLSGGQRQRLEIARSILRNSTILIFDEATSALDPVIEEQVIDNIFRGSHTNIWIAHRFTTIRRADKIFILKDGKIIDAGSHQTLVKQKSSIYFDLFKKDMQKEISL